MPEQKQYEDGIDLRPYLKVIIKRKGLIAAVFLAAVVCTPIVGLLTPKMYQSKVLVLISSKDNSHNDLTLATHALLLTSGAVLKKVVTKLDLKDQHSQNAPLDDLLNKFSVKVEPQTSIFQLIVQDTDPLLAKNLANAWGQAYIQYSGELTSAEIKRTSDLFADQLKVADKSLYDSQERLADFKGQYKIDLMQADLDMKKSKFNSYKSDLLSLEPDIQTQEANLRELKSQIANQNRIIASRAITDALGRPQQDPGDQFVNPIYEDLTKRSIDTEIQLNGDRFRSGYLGATIASAEKDINDLEKTLNQKQIEFEQLSRDIDGYKKTYENLLIRMEEARMSQSRELVEVKVISSAYQSQYPISSNILERMILAGIIALGLGVFLSFAKEALETW